MSEDEQPPPPKKTRSESGAKGKSRAGESDTAELTSLIRSTLLEVLREREENPVQGGAAGPSSSGTGKRAAPMRP